jgi:ankyrin repeat protein
MSVAFTGRNSLSIARQLNDAVRAGDLEKLREIIILSQEEDDITDDSDIHEALAVAAVHAQVEACRFLWAKLSRQGKSIYLEARKNQYDHLHQAVVYGRLDVVRLFIQEFQWNINALTRDGFSPLCFAITNLEMARFLLENGANVNHGGSDFDGPLTAAVRHNNEEVVRLLLVEYQANPNLNRRRPVVEQDASRQLQEIYPRNTDLAILNGNAEILRLLLEHGAFVENTIDSRCGRSSLSRLLCDFYTSRETKLSICHLLVEHAKKDRATAVLIQHSFSYSVQALRNSHNDHCEILLQAGMNPSSRWAWDCAIQAENAAVCRLLVNYGADPYL